MTDGSATVAGEVVEPRSRSGLDPEVEARRRAAIKHIRTFGDPVLRSKALEVERFDDYLKSEADQLVQIMNDSIGVGLAATQLGIMHRMIIYRKIEEQEAVALVNPVIEWCSDVCEGADEGCLSLPGTLVPIERPEAIRVKAKDLDGNDLEVEASGLEARVLQHEVDHLDGVLIIDRTTREMRKLALHHLREGTEMPLPESPPSEIDEEDGDDGE